MQQNIRENYICGKLLTESKIFFCFGIDSQISAKFTESKRNALWNDTENGLGNGHINTMLLIIKNKSEIYRKKLND